jgi:predicted nuclease of predicted toxin-antitoxin system
MRFLVDAQLSPALARYLNQQGHHAEHVIDIGMQAASDRAVWNVAGKNSAVLITKDEDFVVLRAIEAVGPAVVWIRIGNATTQLLMRRFGVAWPQIIQALERGETIVEVN